MYVVTLFGSILTRLTCPGRTGTLLVLYVVVGSLYNYLVLDLRGLDVIPRYSLVSLRGSVSALGTCFARVSERSSSAFHFGGNRGDIGGDYRGLSASRDEEEGMLSGPPGFLDDEDDEPHHDSHNSQLRNMGSNGVIRL